MSRILKFLLNPKMIKAIAFLALIAIVIFVLDIKGWQKAIIVSGIILLWIINILSEKSEAGKSGAALEKALWSQADEQSIHGKRADRASVEENRQKFQEAIEILKKTKKGRSLLGNSALYALPWYMIIGPSAAGKTTAIRESGVESPVLDPVTGKKQEIKGVGGTRNCDWWFMNDALLLDTAGRWVGGLADEDTDEWLNFLKMLRRYRSRKPINGVIVAISIADFNNYNEHQIDVEAQKWRTRIDEVIDELGILFPIYLMFTKCDLINGFVEMFGDMNKTNRSQTWGYTISLEEFNTASPTAIFEKGMHELEKSLNNYRLKKIQLANMDNERNQIFSFPIQFESIEHKLSLFIGHLFRKNPYRREVPLFRGFYYTSGTQEGNPIDFAFKEFFKEKGISNIIDNVFVERVEKKSYFITDLFNKVIIPDQNLAGLSYGGKKRRLFSTVGIFAMVIIALALFIIGISASFQINKSYLEDLKKVFSETKVIDGISTNPEKIKEQLKSLNIVYQKLEGKRPSIWLGLRISGDVFKKGREFYFLKIKTIVLNPIEQEILKLNRQFQDTEYNSNYNILKAYLMLSDSSHRLEPGFIIDQSARINQIDPQYEDFEKQVKFYLKYLNDTDTPAPKLSNIDGLVPNIRQKLLTIKQPQADRVYQNIKSEARGKLESVTFSKILNNISQDALVNVGRIDGMFTREGWKKYVYNAIYKNEPVQDDWVLGIKSEEQDKTKLEELRGQVAQRYFTEYENEWRKFIGTTQFKKFPDLATGGNNLEKLSLPGDSPIYLLLQSVTENTQLPDKPIKENLPDNPFTQNLARRFQPVHLMMGTAATANNQPATIDDYLTLLSSISARLLELSEKTEKDYDAAQLVKSILMSGENEFNQTLRFVQRNTSGIRELQQILELPVLYAWEAINGEAQNYFNRQWEIKVYSKFDEFGKFFPFNPQSEQNAPFLNVADFFGENGILWAFYQDELKDFVIESAGEYRPRTPGGRLSSGIGISRETQKVFGQAQKIRKSLFSQGQMGFTIDIKPFLYQVVSGTNPDVVKTTLAFDGYNLDYFNGPATWNQYQWPGPDPVGSRLTIETKNRNLMPENANQFQFDGYWAFFRLIDAGRILRQDQESKITWLFSKESQYRVNVSFLFRTSTAANPFEVGLFSNFKCPKKLN